MNINYVGICKVYEGITSIEQYAPLLQGKELYMLG
jgi:hypothetical protein